MRKHWLAEFLFKAAVRGRRATSAEQLRQRMERLAHVSITLGQTHHVIHVVRRNMRFYGWALLRATAGADDTNRRYVPILVDMDQRNAEGDIILYFDDEDIPYINKGIVSSSNYLATRSEIDSELLDIYIACVDSADKRKLRQLQAMLDAMAQTARQVSIKATRLTVVNGR